MVRAESSIQFPPKGEEDDIATLTSHHLHQLHLPSPNTFNSAAADPPGGLLQRVLVILRSACSRASRRARVVRSADAARPQKEERSVPSPALRTRRFFWRGAVHVPHPDPPSPFTALRFKACGAARGPAWSGYPTGPETQPMRPVPPPAPVAQERSAGRARTRAFAPGRGRIPSRTRPVFRGRQPPEGANAGPGPRGRRTSTPLAGPRQKVRWGPGLTVSSPR
jgi:hypothetical protein